MSNQAGIDRKNMTYEQRWTDCGQLRRQLYRVEKDGEFLGAAYAIREGLLLNQRATGLSVIPYHEIAHYQIDPPLSLC